MSLRIVFFGEERQEDVSPCDKTSYHRGACTVKLADEYLPPAWVGSGRVSHVSRRDKLEFPGSIG